jgi:hypothetical protein
MVSIDISRFNLNLVQQGLYFCIPSCIRGMMKFQDQNFNLSQEEIMQKITNYASDRQPSFGAAETSAPNEFSDFEINQLLPNDYIAWEESIKKEIDNGFPIAISTRTGPDSTHIRLVLGYDNQAEYFLLYNPGTSLRFEANGLFSNQIVGGCESLTFSEAENLFNAPNACRDLLTIRKK